MPPFKGAVDGGVGSLMCSYNLINGTYACENGAALDILKSDDTKSGGLGFQGWVMSDWGATHSTVPSAMAGLDQVLAVLAIPSKSCLHSVTHKLNGRSMRVHL